MFKMKVTRQLVILLSLSIVVAIVFAFRLTQHFSRLSVERTRLTHNLQETFALNLRLHQGIEREIHLLNHQLGQLDPRFNEAINETNFQLGEMIMQYVKLDLGEEERLTVERIRNLHSELAVCSSQIYAQLHRGERAEAIARIQQVEALGDNIAKEFGTLDALQVQKLQAMSDQMDRTARGGVVSLYVFAALFFLMLVGFTLVLRHRILHPLKQVLDAADHIRKGDLTARAPRARDDEIGQLALGFNFMAESLAENYAELERKVEERTRQLNDLQAQFVQSEKMSAMGQLVGGVAHELNNPLTVILGFAELEKMRLTSRGADPSTIKVMEDIYSQADRCRRIVANLLQVARRQEPQRVPTRINKVVEEVLQLRDYELQSRNIQLVREFDPTDPILHADPQKIQQVVFNILNNAIDAIQDKSQEGKIWVRTRALGGTISLEFLDNGTGIREPRRIFDPFYTTKEVGKGTGLGLSVCYSIVKEHGGAIRAENWEQGARFLLTLPVGSAPEVQKVETPALPYPAKGGKDKGTVLIVDDEEALLKLQTSFLTSAGFKTHGVKTGEEAVQVLENQQVDLIVSDVRMPGKIDGVQLYTWVCQHRPELRKRFAFVSGDVVAITTGELSSLSEVPQILKPFQLGNYSRVIHQLLEA